MAVRKRQNVETSLSMENEPLVHNMRPNLKGDEKNILLLLFLYTLQGIPLGLAAAIPMILQNKGVSYKQQAEFSFVHWPFSLKLLWAPIVDSMFSTRIGRRKSWLIPTQYLLGASMLFLSRHIDNWLGPDGKEPNINLLTVLFFGLNFLAATQDIVVDGWALTMLKKRNLGHASTCNSVGQTTGYFLGFVLFLALESAEFCNNYIRFEPQTDGIVTLSGFLFFWGCIFFVTTTLVALLKTEIEPHDSEHEIVHERSLKTAYTSLLNIIKLPPIRTLAVVLLTVKVGYSATDAALGLKLVESGVPKEKLGLMAVPVVPLQIVLPLIMSKYTIGPKPMDIYLRALPFRLMFGVLAAGLVWVTPLFVHDHVIPFQYFIILFFSYAIHQICVYCMFVSVMAFFARISDPTVGGTYMTLLNTLSNLGGNWPLTLALWFIDPLTTRTCVGHADILRDNTCRDALEREICLANDGTCKTIIDGFYIETLICTVIGFVWMFWIKRKINYLQGLEEGAWRLDKRRSS